MKKMAKGPNYKFRYAVIGSTKWDPNKQIACSSGTHVDPRMGQYSWIIGKDNKYGYYLDI